jgi:hypothetical protein
MSRVPKFNVFKEVVTDRWVLSVFAPNVSQSVNAFIEPNTVFFNDS